MGEYNFTRVLGEAVVLPIFGASGSPTACHEDLGDARQLLLENDVFAPGLQKLRRFCNARMRPYIVFDGITFLNIINTFPFFKICFLEHVTRWNPTRFPPTDPFRHQDDQVARKDETKQGETPEASRACTNCRRAK